MKKYVALALLVTASLSAIAGPKMRECADNVSELRNLVANSDFPTSWIETGGNDGMPLTMTISDSAGQLKMDFVKKNKGMFVQATATLCKDGGKYVAKVKGSDLIWGPAADPMIKGMVGNGGADVTIKLPYTNQMMVKLSKGFMGMDLKFGVN